MQGLFYEGYCKLELNLIGKTIAEYLTKYFPQLIRNMQITSCIKVWQSYTNANRMGDVFKTKSLNQFAAGKYRGEIWVSLFIMKFQSIRD